MNIAERLEREIAEGKIESRLPSEKNLAKRFSATTITVRKALDVLDRKYLITKIPSVGVFVKSVEKPTVRICWLTMHKNDEVENILMNCVRNHFKDIDVKFIKGTGGISDFNQFDLFTVPATSSISYSEFAEPFPAKVIGKYGSDQYYSLPFDVHRINNFYFGLPFLFSPLLLILNRKLISGLDIDIAPYHFDIAALHRLADWARKRGLFLWTLSTVYSMFRILIFNCSNGTGEVREVNMSELDGKMKKFWPLMDKGLVIDDYDPGIREKCILKWTCRQNDFFDLECGDYELLPVPEEIGAKSLMTGHFLLLSGRAAYPESALEVAEFFLSGEVQRLIAEYKIGLPVLKSCAADSIDSRKYRDDLYFCETNNVFANNAQEQEFLMRLNSTLDRALESGMELETFMAGINYEIDMTREKHKRKNNAINGGNNHAA